MKKTSILMACIIFFVCLSGCDSDNDPVSRIQMREKAFVCFSEHKDDICKIIESQSAIGKTSWCEGYDLLSNGEYEFDLYRWGFTGMNIQSGILYLPNDVPDLKYIQDDDNVNIYNCEIGQRDKFYLERMEQNWFYFYSEYDF